MAIYESLGSVSDSERYSLSVECSWEIPLIARWMRVLHSASAAMSMGRFRSLLRMLVFAPLSSNIRTHSAWPFHAAACNAVSPSLFWKLQAPWELTANLFLIYASIQRNRIFQQSLRCTAECSYTEIKDVVGLLCQKVRGFLTAYEHLEFNNPPDSNFLKRE